MPKTRKDGEKMQEEGSVVIKIDGDDSGLKSKLNDVESLGKGAISALATAAAAVGTAIAGIGTYAVKVGSDFEAGMSKVQAISGATAEDMEKLTAKAKEMGATTKFSASESAEALQYMAMAGWKTEQMTEGLPGIMNLAAASGESLATTSDIVTDALTAFGLQASDSAHFSDVLAQASSNANTNVSLMGATFKYAAPIAGSLGYSIEDVAVATGLMANAGIKGEQAGTALRSIFTRLSAPPKAAAKAIDQMGIAMTDAQGKMLPFSEVMEQLRHKFNGLSEAEQVSYAKALAGTEAMSGLLAIVNASQSDYDKLTAAIQRADGAAKEMADMMNDNLQGQMTLLGSAVEGVGIEIYDSLETPLKDAVKTANTAVGTIAQSLNSGTLKYSLETVGKGIGTLISKFAELASVAIPKVISAFAFFVSHGKAITTALEIATAAVVTFKATFVFDTLLAAWRSASAAVAAYTSAQAAATTSLTIGQAAVGVLTGQLNVAAVAQGLLNAAIAANPFTLAATGAVALGIAMTAVIAATSDSRVEFEEYDERVEETNAKIDAMRESQEALAQTRAENINTVNAQIAAVQSYVAELDSYLDADGKVREGYEMRAEYLANEINNLIPGAVSAYNDESGAHYAIKDSIDQEILAKQKSMLLDAMQEEYMDALQNRLQAHATLVKCLQEQGEAQQHVNDLQALMNELQAAQVELMNSSDPEKVITLMDGTAVSLTNLADKYNDISNNQSIWQQKLEESNANVTEAQSTFDTYRKSIEDFNNISAVETLDELNSAIVGLSGTITQATDDNKQELAQAVADMQVSYDAMVTQAANTWDSMSDAQKMFMTSMLQEMKLQLDQQVKAASDGGFNISNALGDGVAKGAYKYPAEIQALIDDGKAKLDAAGTATIGSGENFMVGFSAGIQSNIKTVLDLVADTGTQSVDALNQSLDEHSPSQKTRQSGVYFSQGLAEGIKAGKSGVIAASVQVATAAVTAAKEALDIHSPSRVMKDQVGRMAAQGICVGITKETDAVIGAIKLLSETAIDQAKDNAENWEEIGSLYVEDMTYGIEKLRDKSIQTVQDWVDADTEAYNSAVDAATKEKTDALEKQIKAVEDAYEKQIDAAGKNITKAQKKQYQEERDAKKEDLNAQIKDIESNAKKQKTAYAEAAKEVTSTYKTALTDGYGEALDIVQERVQAITKEAQTQYDDIQKNIASMQKELAGADLYTLGDDKKTIKLTDWEKETEKLEQYNDAMCTLKEQLAAIGAEDFLSQVTDLGLDEGLAFAEKLNSMSESDFTKYITGWQAQQAKAKEIAEQFYADQLKALEENFTTKLDEELAGVPELMANIGQESIQGMIQGMYSQSGALSEAAKQIANKLVQEVRQDLDIHSPSRKMAKLVGQPMAQGVTVGFNTEMDKVYKAIDQTLTTQLTELSRGVRVQAQQEAAAADTAYAAQTAVLQPTAVENKTVVEFSGSLAALGRVLTPVIQTEQVRAGKNFLQGG